MSMAAGKRLPLGLKMGHGLGSVAMGVKETGLTTFFMLYYNQVLGYDPRVISMVLIVAMFADAIVDPLIGRWSDATRTKWGRRVPWLYAAALPMAISWAFLWTYREPAAQSVVMLALNVIAVRIFVSACEIPAASLTAELTQDYDERTGLTRFRFLFGWTGGLITTALAYGYFLVSSDGSQNGLLNAKGYESFGYFGAGLLLISTIASAMAQHKRVVALPERAAPAHSLSMFGDLYRAFRNPSFKALAIGALFIVASYGSTVAAINYMMLYVWQLTSPQISLYPAGLAFAVLGAFLLVSPLHRRFGKRNSAIAGIIISAVITALTYTARNLGLWPELGTNFAAALLLLLFTSALLGQIITTISASSMIAEIVEDHEASHGERCEGMFFAGYFMVQKFGQALGIFVVGQMIAWAGLGGQISPADLPPHIADNMGWAFVGIVLVLGIGAAFALQHYRINRSDHEARVAAIAAKNMS
jgi:GPH family glycoside/pentoside/hexuronide:cation symporter